MSSNTTPAAVFFDLDGTLLDTAEDLLAALNHVFITNSFHTVTLEQLIPLISKGSKQIIKNLLNQEFTEEELALFSKDFIIAYNTHAHQYTKFFPNIDKVLAHLNEKNIPWGVITNKTTALTMPIIELFMLKQLKCRTVVCADTTEFSKPHAAPMLKACSDLNIDPSKAIFVGDAITDIQAGKAVNMTTIAAAYGYIDPTEDVKSWQADYIIREPGELLGYI